MVLRDNARAARSNATVAVAIDGKPQSFDPTQDVEITIDETGAVQAKSLSADAPRPDEDTPDEGADAGAPPQ